MNVVFDLGGVLVAWQPVDILKKAFPDPAMREIARREIIGHDDWLEIDRGKLTMADAIPHFAAKSGIAEEIIRAFIEMVPAELVAKPETVELLHRVKAAGNAIYLLSNMPGETFEYLERTHDFWHAFDGRVVSGYIGHCKPEPAIYEHLLETFDLEPAETVFIDDVQANIDAARRHGIHGIRFESAEQVERELERLGCL